MINSHVRRPALRYHGSKWRIAPKIIQLFPKHRRYVEPFGGGASVLLRKQRVSHEIYNDLDDRVVNLFTVLRNHTMTTRLIEQLNATPYSRSEFKAAFHVAIDPIEDARRLIVLSCMGFSSDSATRKGRSGFRAHRDAVSTFAHGFDHLSQIQNRLNGVVIENSPAINIIKSYDSADTLFYIDPPYVLSTCNNRGGGYRHELSDSDHEQLAQLLNKVTGSVVLSGYASDLYRDLYAGWQCHELKALAQSNKGNATRIECVWVKHSEHSAASVMPMLDIVGDVA